MTPRRIQRKRAKGWRSPAGSVYVGRPTVFGNPWALSDLRCQGERAGLVALYREWLAYKVDDYPEARSRLFACLSELRGKDLACWCPLPEAGQVDHCHAAVLLALANVGTP